MKRNPSWKINENYKLLNNKFDTVIKTAIQYTNELNESDLKEVQDLLDDAILEGWYPFITEIYKEPNNISRFDYISEIKKDEIIFEFLMLEQEVDILKEFSDVNVEEFKERIKSLKGKL